MALDYGAGVAPVSSSAIGGSGNTAQKSLDTTLAKVLKANVSAQTKASAQNIANGGHSSNWFQDILSAIDLPRSLVVAGVHQLLHAPNVHPDFGQDVSKHIGYGDIVHEVGIKNGLGARALGFAGDVGLDPLTYLTLGTGDAAELGAKGLLEHVGELASNDAVPEITADTFQRVAQKGSAGLNDLERAKLAEEGIKPGGLSWRVPLTKTAEHLGIADSPTYLPLVPHELTDPLTAAKTQLFNYLKDSKVGQALGEKFASLPELNTPLLRQVVRNGSPDEALTAFKTLQAAPLLRDIPRGFVQQHLGNLLQALKDIKPEDDATLRNALEGDKAAQAALPQFQGVRDVLDAARANANAEGLHVADLQDYFPHQVTAEARARFADSQNLSPGVSAAESSPEVFRSLRPGEKFLGVTLKTGSKDEIDKIGREVLGDNYKELFKGGPREVLPAYIRALGYRTGEAAFAKRLVDNGVIGANLTRDTVNAARESADQMATAQTVKGVAQAPLTNPEAQDLAHPSTIQQAGNLVKSAVDHFKPDAVSSKSVYLGENAGAELAGKKAPAFIDDSLRIARDWQNPTGFAKALKTYDKYLSLWKSYELLSPGKALRHQVAALWGANLGNVSADNMGRYLKLASLVKDSGLDALKEDDRNIFEEMQRRGVLHGSVTGDEFATPESKLGSVASKANPLSSNFLPVQKNWELQGKAQDVVRGAMFYDAMKKGLSADMAAQKVKTFLFNASELSPFERNVMRRVIPFYTFMRTQFPLQLQQLAIQPGKFTAAEHLFKNISLGAPPINGPVPSYYDQTGSVELPFKLQGQPAFVSPDLPFERLGEMFSGGGKFGPLPSTGPLSLDKVISNLSPVLKSPIESFAGKQAYSGLPFTDKANPVPASWSAVPGLDQVLGKLGLAMQAKADFTTPNGEKVKKGDWLMTDRAAYQLEGAIPPLGQVRRLLPGNEPSFEGRATSTRLAWLLGQNFRTLTPSAQHGEMLRRQTELQALVKRLQNVGAIPRGKATSHGTATNLKF